MHHNVKHFTKCILWNLESAYRSYTEYTLGDTTLLHNQGAPVIINNNTPHLKQIHAVRWMESILKKSQQIFVFCKVVGPFDPKERPA